MKSIAILITFIFLCDAVFAQLKRPAPPQKKIDTLHLSCPLASGKILPVPKDGYRFKDDLKAVLKSTTDTLFLAPVDGKIDLITRGDGGKYEVVMHYFNYNIWITGISEIMVKKNDKMKTGHPIGKINPGDEVEILLFDDEEPVDPVKYLECRKE